MDYSILKLPEIERYGGDTVPITLDLYDPDGYVSSLTGLPTVALTLAPYGGGNVVLSVAGTVGAKLAGHIPVTFSFDTSDTALLSGMYIYQVLATFGTKCCRAQGVMRIVKNIDPRKV